MLVVDWLFNRYGSCTPKIYSLFVISRKDVNYVKCNNCEYYA